MDRLVVGDVGYGKTEVALRAAFKATQDGKQVAVLVPTTVLAAQHHATFSQRFAAFPLEVRLLSRFVSAEEQAATIAGLADGTVDIVIGTHRLLSEGRPIQGPRARRRRRGAALRGGRQGAAQAAPARGRRADPVRDADPADAQPGDGRHPRPSVIETPPEDRLPIQTRVAEASAGLVRDAILRELDRGGQVFYVHNRVETIEAQAEQLRRLLPDARFVVGHGQMAEGALEKVMIAFADGAADVLVCTTIIESGLDIPNANTIIIDRADTLGLAQLYQLRGRVGRSSRRAYAYLLYRRRERLSDEARKRLQAIFNASELGAGFQIALSDLEIRGAGNILGGEQSGHMAAVGFDLYSRMLAEAVEERKAGARAAHRSSRRRRPSSTCRSTRTCPTTTSPTRPRSSSSIAGWRRRARPATSPRSARRSPTGSGRCRRRSTRLVEVAELRLAAEAAGVASISREEGWLVVRFGASLTRADGDAPARRGRAARRAPIRRHVREQPGPHPGAAPAERGVAADAGGRGTAIEHSRRPGSRDVTLVPEPADVPSPAGPPPAASLPAPPATPTTRPARGSSGELRPAACRADRGACPWGPDLSRAAVRPPPRSPGMPRRDSRSRGTRGTATS